MIMLTKMNLEKKIINDIKSAMLAKDKLRLEVCRSIKSAILISKTEKNGSEINYEKEIKIYRSSSNKELSLLEYTQVKTDMILQSMNKCKQT